jgi:hypothetical protein
MNYIFLIASTFILLTIAYQDFTSRSVVWVCFPLLALAGMGHSWLDTHSPSTLGAWFSINIGFLLLQFALLKAYFFIKEPARPAFIDSKIGWGDILFLVAACFFFSPLNFIIFYIGSLVFTICVYAALRWIFQRGGTWTVPLAGLQAVFFILFTCISGYYHYSLLNDDWLLFKWTSL